MVAFFVYSIITAGILAATFLSPAAPDWLFSISFVSNVGLLSFTSLLAFLAYRQEMHYRGVFFYIWLYFALVALAVPAHVLVLSLGIRDAEITAFVWVGLISPHATLAFSLGSITVDYMSSPRRRLINTSLASLGLFAIAGWLYSPYIWDPLAILVQDDTGRTVASYDSINRSSVILNVYSLLMLLAFYVHKYRTDRPIGAFADTLLFLFGLALAVDTAELMLPESDLKHLIISQWAILFINLGMALSLALRLKFKSQNIADYYESQCLSDDPAIDRRIGSFDRFILRTFFDPEKVGQKVFLGTGSAQMRVRRTPSPVTRRTGS